MIDSNSVFISYRRDVSAYIALAVFQDLHANGIDPFYDIETIKAGQFATIILNQIAARPYFIPILTPGTLDRCVYEGDWVRQEIEQAVRLDRLIIPLHTPEFDFSDIDKYLAPDVAASLKGFNMLEIPHRYFKYAMQEVRAFLVPTALKTQPTPKEDREAVQSVIQEAVAEPAITEQQLTAQEYFERANASVTVEDKLANYSRAIELDPTYMRAYNNRGVTFSDNGEHDKAIQDFDRAIELEPRIASTYSNRGNAYYDKKDYDNAIKDYTEALRLDPYNAFVYYSRGNAYSHKWHFGSAIRDYDEAIRLDPELVEAYILRAYAHAEKQNPAKAVADAEKALSLNDSHKLATVLKQDMQKWRALI